MFKFLIDCLFKSKETKEVENVVPPANLVGYIVTESQIPYLILFDFDGLLIAADLTTTKVVFIWSVNVETWCLPNRVFLQAIIDTKYDKPFNYYVRSGLEELAKVHKLVLPKNKVEETKEKDETVNDNSTAIGQNIQ